MLAAAARRTLTSLLALFGLSIVVFALARLVPGDTATALLGLQQDPQTVAALREQYALDRPIVMQYGVWIGNLLTCNPGTSVSGPPVAELIGRALPVTLQLAGWSLLLGVGLGIPLGTLAALNRGGRLDALTTAFSVLGLSVPAFWAGTLLILLFALKLGWLPSGQHVSIETGMAEHARHLILPVTALGLAVIAVMARTTRSAVVDALQRPHVQTAKAKGLPRFTLIRRHVLANAWPPIITIAGLQAGYLLGGSVVIETVFSLPGLGSLILRALGERDYPTLQAAILLVGTVFITINLLTDLITAPLGSQKAGGDQ